MFDEWDGLRAFRIDANDTSPHTPPLPLRRMVRWGGTSLMAEGYCVKCKAKKEIADGVEEIMKNGRKAIKGKCPTCGTVMFKILGGKATPPASAATPPTANP